MARLVKLFDEKQLLVNMQSDTLVLIRDCRTIEAIKRFVQCYDILKLTWEIQERHPKPWTELECDEFALLELRTLTRELSIGYRAELPKPGFDFYDTNVRRLLMVFRVPRKRFANARSEDRILTEELPPDLSRVLRLDVPIRGSDDET